MSLVLHAFPPSPRAFKVLFALHQLEISYDLKVVNLLKGEQNAPGHKALNPNGRMPVIDDGGFVLWESNAILEYLAAKKPEAGFLPEEPKARANVTKWLFWESAHWDPACAIFTYERFVKGIFGRGAPDPKEIERGEQSMARLGPVLDGALHEHRYVAGERPSVADIALGASLVMAEQAQFPLEPYRNIQRWKTELAGLPGWKKAAEIRDSFVP